MQAVALGRQEKFGDARELLKKTESVLDSITDTKLNADQAYHRAWLFHLTGDPGESYRICESAILGYEVAGDSSGLASAHYLQGLNAVWRGDSGKGCLHYQQGMELFEGLGDDYGRAKCLVGLGGISQIAGSGDGADGLVLIEKALAIFERVGDRYAQGVCYSNMGQLYRARGEMEDAYTVLSKGREVMNASGATDISLNLNLICTLIDLQRFEEAEEMLQELLQDVLDSERSGFLGVIYATLLPCQGAREDWETWEETIMLAAGHLRDNTIVDEELAKTFEIAAEQAMRADREDLALQAFEQALGQWQALKTERKIAELERRVQKIRR